MRYFYLWWKNLAQLLWSAHSLQPGTHFLVITSPKHPICSLFHASILIGGLPAYQPSGGGGRSPVLSERIREFPERLWRCNSRWNLRNYSANAGLALRLSNPLVWHRFSLSPFKSLTLSPKARPTLNSSKPVNHLKWRQVVLVFLHCLLASRYYCCCRYLKTSWDHHWNLIRNYHRKIVSSPSNLEELNSVVEWVFKKGREREGDIAPLNAQYGTHCVAFYNQ